MLTICQGRQISLLGSNTVVDENTLTLDVMMNDLETQLLHMVDTLMHSAKKA